MGFFFGKIHNEKENIFVKKNIQKNEKGGGAVKGGVQFTGGLYYQKGTA